MPWPILVGRGFTGIVVEPHLGHVLVIEFDENEAVHAEEGAESDEAFAKFNFIKLADEARSVGVGVTGEKLEGVRSVLILADVLVVLSKPSDERNFVALDGVINSTRKSSAVPDWRYLSSRSKRRSTVATRPIRYPESGASPGAVGSGCACEYQYRAYSGSRTRSLRRVWKSSSLMARSW
jgi:hypothetical protein